MRSRLQPSIQQISLWAGHEGVVEAADATYTDGPWDLPEHLHKVNGVLKYTVADAASGFSIEGMGYDAKWRSTDQIPQRAVQEGLIGRFGAIDPTDGGKTHRYSVSANWWESVGPGHIKALVYGIDYRLDLYSNFTYFIDPNHGDQFEQFDKRHVYGNGRSLHATARAIR